MPACLVVQPISEPGRAILREAGLTIIDAPAAETSAFLPFLDDVVAVVTRNAGFDAAAIAAAPKLKVIAVHGTGVDRVAVAAASARGIPVLNTPGANAESVAELTFALMLAAARRLTAADAAVRAGDDTFRYREIGIELAGRRLGLVGFGSIAQAVARRALAFGMSVAVHSAHAKPEQLAALGLIAMPDLDQLCATSDVVSLHGVPGPKPLIDAARLKAMKPGALLINTARGRLVDEAVLAEALTNGHLGGAALDVFAEEPPPVDHPLLKAPNLIVAPHLGGATLEALDRMAIGAAQGVADVLAGRRPADCVNRAVLEPEVVA
jgi:phosphoglycerate dehydrogenase-like enzyme